MPSVTTSTSSTGLRLDTPVSETSQMGFLNSEFNSMMNNTATSAIPLSVAGSASNGSNNVTVANTGGGVVTIKQEPLTNHEEEMETQGVCLSVCLGGGGGGGVCGLSVLFKRLHLSYGLVPDH